MQRLSALVLWLGAVGLWAASASAADAPLKAGDYVAVIGDSITEQRIYSLFIEDYLLMCKPAADLRVTQFGWGGETAPGYARRMANDTLPFKPGVATTCFGMNDGGYSPMDPEKAKRYRDGQQSIVHQLKEGGARLIVLGSPGCVDSDTFGNHNAERATMYNKVLAELRDIARDVAKDEHVVFADVFTPMSEVMAKAKAKFGHEYHVGGGDGIHPDRNGHLVMAYAFLKALGCDGKIGTITVDLPGSRAEATDGHKVVSFQNGRLEIESQRYPFCFFGDPAQTSSTRGVIEFIPFNEELNRFMLVVHGVKGGKMKVTWGKGAKDFTAAELDKGINLAAEFLDNPFCEAFQKVEAKIADQQGMEVGLIKTLMHTLPEYERTLPQEKPTIERMAKALIERDKAAREASAAAVTPVKHAITLEPVSGS